MEIRPGMIHWPSTAEPAIEWEYRLDAGDPYDVSSWRLGSHNGTHVDAPSHFIAGAAGVADVSMDTLVGSATVIDLPDRVSAIDRGVVEGLDLVRVRRVLFRTSNSRYRLERLTFDPEYVAITADGAEALVEAGIRTVGLDYLSIEQYDAAAPLAHLALLGAGVAVIEGCDLRAVVAGDYQLYCLPLRLAGSEAAPARAILIEARSTGSRIS
jgi:arylformamidase